MHISHGTKPSSSKKATLLLASRRRRRSRRSKNPRRSGKMVHANRANSVSMLKRSGCNDRLLYKCSNLAEGSTRCVTSRRSSGSEDGLGTMTNLGVSKAIWRSARRRRAFEISSRVCAELMLYIVIPLSNHQSTSFCGQICATCVPSLQPDIRHETSRCLRATVRLDVAKDCSGVPEWHSAEVVRSHRSGN